jgi:hypothetical protein
MQQHPDTLEFEVTLSREMTTATEGSQGVDGFRQESAGGVRDGLMPALIPAYVAPDGARGGGEASRESGTNFFTCGLLPNSTGGARPFVLGMRTGDSYVGEFTVTFYRSAEGVDVTREWPQISGGDAISIDPTNGGGQTPDWMTFRCVTEDLPPSAVVTWSIGYDGNNGTGEGIEYYCIPPMPMNGDEIYGDECPMTMTITDGTNVRVVEAKLAWHGY